MDNLAYELWNSVSEILDIGDIERAFEQKTGKRLAEPKPLNYYGTCC